MNNALRTVDLFCGGGGLSLGLSNAGFDIIAAFDVWDAAVKFYNANIHTHRAYIQDLSDVTQSIETIKKWNPDVIVGGPPCQDFSSAGKRNENGGRASLTLSYAKIVTAIKPRLFIMENVDRASKCKTFTDALELFRDAGYSISISILNSSLCGVPQKRKRTIAVGILNEDALPLEQVYQTNLSLNPMTIKDYFGDTLKLNYYYRHPRSYLRRGIFSVNEPSPTIRGVNRPIPKGYPGHPGDAHPLSKDIRPLTTKERSMIQTFPSSWNLIGNKSDVEQIIGNAVPVKLAEFVGQSILKCINDKKHSS